MTAESFTNQDKGFVYVHRHLIGFRGILVDEGAEKVLQLTAVPDNAQALLGKEVFCCAAEFCEQWERLPIKEGSQPETKRLLVRFEVDLPASEFDHWKSYFMREIRDSVEESTVLNRGRNAIGEIKEQRNLFTHQFEEIIVGRWEGGQTQNGGAK